MSGCHARSYRAATSNDAFVVVVMVAMVVMVGTAGAKACQAVRMFARKSCHTPPVQNHRHGPHSKMPTPRDGQHGQHGRKESTARHGSRPRLERTAEERGGRLWRTARHTPRRRMASRKVPRRGRGRKDAGAGVLRASIAADPSSNLAPLMQCRSSARLGWCAVCEHRSRPKHTLTSTKILKRLYRKKETAAKRKHLAKPSLLPAKARIGGSMTTGLRAEMRLLNAAQCEHRPKKWRGGGISRRPRTPTQGGTVRPRMGGRVGGRVGRWRLAAPLFCRVDVAPVLTQHGSARRRTHGVGWRARGRRRPHARPGSGGAHGADADHTLARNSMGHARLLA